MESPISASPTLSSNKAMENMPYAIVSTLVALQWWKGQTSNDNTLNMIFLAYV